MKAARFAIAMLFAPVGAGLMTLTGCGSEPSTQVQQKQLITDSDATLKDLETAEPSLTDMVKNSAGYVVYPNVTVGALGVKVESGNGDVYQNGKYIGTSHLGAGDIGLSAGGETYSELIVFQTPEALSQFENNKLHFDAGANAVILQAGATASPKYTNGVAVVKHSKGGLLLDASIGAQQFTFKAANAQPATMPS